MDSSLDCVYGWLYSPLAFGFPHLNELVCSLCSVCERWIDSVLLNAAAVAVDGDDSVVVVAVVAAAA